MCSRDGGGQGEGESSASDRRRRAAIVGQGQLENLAHDGPPAVLATAAATIGDDDDDNDEHILLSKASRFVAESTLAGGTRTGSSKNQQDRGDRGGFERAYEKYYSNELLFSKPIIAVDKSTTRTAPGVERPEKCKEYQPRCSSAGNFSRKENGVSSRRTKIENRRIVEMPAAVQRIDAETNSNSKLNTNLNSNFSLPPSPQRSSSSTSTSDGPSSAFFAMAKRLHRLRIAATSPNRHDPIEANMAPKDSRGEEFLSIEPLTTTTIARSNSISSSTLKSADDMGEENDNAPMPQISTISSQDNQRSNNLNIDHRQFSSQTGVGGGSGVSTTPSLSDISVASYHRLPTTQQQIQTSDVNNRGGFQRQTSITSLGKSKIWSSEPVLISNNNPARDGQFATLDNNGYRDVNGHQSFLTNADGRRGMNGIGSPSLQRLNENPSFSNHFSSLLGALQRTGINGSETNVAGAQDDRFTGSGSWNYSALQRQQLFPSAKTSDTYGSDTNLMHEGVGTLPPQASLPPLPPRLGHLGSKNGGTLQLPSSSSMNNGIGNETTAPSTSKNGEATTSTTTNSILDNGSMSRFMDAVSRHPLADVDYSKLKSILREQRKSYKRRLERERAKREALEDLLVKLNSTPRTQQRSFSNSSSTASTVRNNIGNTSNRRQSQNENGRSSADLGDVVLNSLRSNSIDGNSTNSEDVFLLELIQQHLRMKQALIGHLGKRNTTGSSSTSGGEQDHHQHHHLHHHDRVNVPTKFPTNGLDEDDIPMGGEAATNATNAVDSEPANNSTNRLLLNGKQQVGTNGEFVFTDRSKLMTKSKSVDYGRNQGGELNGLIDKETLKLILDNNSSTGGSENGGGGRSSSSERRKQRRKWETNNNSGGRGSGKESERGGAAISTQRSTARSTTPRPSVAFFVSAETKKETEAPENGVVELKETKPLQNAFQERQRKFIQRSMSRLDQIKAASELRSETSRRVRELADNVAHGRMRLEEASEQLLVYELPQPSAFSRLEMFRASKMKFEQLPETLAKRNKLKKESDLATNRVLAKMFKQKMDYKRLLKKSAKLTPTATLPSSGVSTSNDRLLNR